MSKRISLIVIVVGGLAWGSFCMLMFGDAYLPGLLASVLGGALIGVSVAIAEKVKF